MSQKSFSTATDTTELSCYYKELRGTVNDEGMEVGYGENMTMEACEKFCDEIESCNSFRWCDDVCYLKEMEDLKNNKIIAEIDLLNQNTACVTAYKYCELGNDTTF